MSSSSDDNETWSSSESDASPVEVAHTKTKIMLSKFLAKLRPRMLNLMNEFADADMFLIDGDSLLIELLLDTNLDWCYGGQFLHLIYLCERYLHLFVRKGGVFQLVFFQDFQDLWKCEPSLYLARQVLKIHLSEHVENKVLCKFNNPWDPSFVEYVNTFCPSFILLSDGEFMDRLASRPFSIPKIMSDVFVCELDQCLKLGLNCAFTAGVEFGPSTLDAYHVESNDCFMATKLAGDYVMDKVRFDNKKPEIVIEQNIENILGQFSNTSVDHAEECKNNGSRDLDCRLFLHVATASIYLKSLADQPCKASQLDIVRLVLLHGVLLTELPLKYRALSLGKCDEIKEPVVRQNLLRCFANIQFVMSEFLESLLISPLAWSKVDICDVWDGRLLFVLLSVLLTAKRNGEGISLSPCSKRKFISLVNDVSSMSGEEIKPFPLLSSLGENLHSDLESVLNFTQSRNDQASSSDSCLRVIEHLTSPELEQEGLIEVDCPLLTKYAGAIVDTPLVKKLDLDDPSVAALVMSGNDFDETYHWHSGKPLSDGYDRIKESKFEAKDKKDEMRQQGKYATHMRRYGESLEGELKSKPIVVENHGGKRGKKDKCKISKGAQKIIDESNKKKEEEGAKKEAQLWVKEQKRLQYLVEQQKYDDALAKIVNLIEKVSVKKIIIDVLMMKAKVYRKKWKLICESKEVPLEIDIIDAVMQCFLAIRELVENHVENLQKKDKAVLGEYLVELGFGDIAVKTSLLKELIPSSGGSLNMSSARFQMQCIGHQLKRETRTDRDPRVDNFIPETWQRELLNAVDNKQSALIVAPTSSGKTFASYYCMERVLKEDNEGVVVYVSPTKALVNQVAATCYARYHSKIMPAGKSVYGVFTRDYRTNTLNSQILVTVPQCLEILLLSPHRQEWAAKIKYVVFDEVHCLGTEIGAEFWEHLLLLVRCPFLALSATIRNPYDLHKWLQHAEDSKRERDEKSNTVRPNSPKSYEVALVTYHERYSDLEKFNYVPIADAKKASSQVNSEIKHIHPCAMLTFRQLINQSPTFPAHITLSPRETLALFDAMVKAWPEKDTMQSLCPDNHFKDTAFISKPDVRLYEAALKKELMTWVVDRPRIEMVIVGLGGKTESEFGTQKTGAGYNYVIQQFYPLLQELHENNKLPAIFFSYDRKLCEKLMNLTVKHLCKKEKMLQHEPNVQRKAKIHEKQSRQVAKLEKRFRDDDADDDDEKLRKTNSTGHKNSHKKRKQVTSEATCFLFDNPPKESCSFAGVGVLDEEDARVIVRKLQRFQKANQDLPDFNKGLRRGVSFHHAGMSSGKRRIVEMLFRKKFLRVVFATGTLALGIHMPCKTVIFAGDSVFLNTLQFHQISGRAGRRGFDLLGNVIFLGIPQPKIQRLMTNNLPRIIGNFPLNATLILRLLLMVNKVDDRETATNQALALLQNPLICMDQPELELQLKHHFLFSVELLVRQGLIDQKGVPQGLAGLATHLHYHEPSNFVLIAFLHEGIFHDFCKRGRSVGGKFSKDFLKSLVVVLSHLFARVKLHHYILRGHRSTSRVVLDELPPKFKKALAKYNNRVNGIFDLYLRTVATHVHNTMAEDITLPLSNASLISSKSYSAEPDATESGPTVEETLQGLSLPFKACSAFAALSGNTDNHLYSSDDRISNIRYQVYTDIKVVPIVKDDVTLNAYVVDFFNHGNVKALTSENGIMRGEVFNLLKDFLLVLKSIHVSLSELGPEDGDAVIAAFGQLFDEYSSLFNKAYDLYV